MFGLGENLDYYFCVGDVSMRKGIDALCGVIRHQMGRDPLSGEVYIFMSHDKTRVKLLQWQRGGFVLYYKQQVTLLGFLLSKELLLEFYYAVPTLLKMVKSLLTY